MVTTGSQKITVRGPGGTPLGILRVNVISYTVYIYKLSCVTVVCKHFASYQGYPNYRWDLIRYTKG
jgi:hypothetical protein